MRRARACSFPVAHGEGNYFADDETLDRLEGEGRVVFRYADGDNPNGSARNIAGILNEKRNVLGLMPHPERVVDPLLGGTDGRGAVREPDRNAVVTCQRRLMSFDRACRIAVAACVLAVSTHAT